jgi:outer membrane receptor protein involved in Fe transport
MQKLSLLLNATYVYSRLELGEDQLIEQLVDHRPLMGQSPYIINAGLNYTDDSTGLKINVSYNIIGKRLVVIGNRKVSAVWELPRHSLDLTFSKRIDKALELKGGVQNMLNSRFVFAQDMNRNGKFDIVNNDYEFFAHKEHDNRYQSYFQRAYFTLGIGVKL